MDELQQGEDEVGGHQEGHGPSDEGEGDVAAYEGGADDHGGEEKRGEAHGYPEVDKVGYVAEEDAAKGLEETVDGGDEDEEGLGVDVGLGEVRIGHEVEGEDDGVGEEGHEETGESRGGDGFFERK